MMAAHFESVVQPTTKDIETLQAEFALKGHQMLAHSNGTFTVTRWNLARHCISWSELLAFASRVGVRHGV